MTVLSIAVKGCRPSLFPSVGFTILKRSKRNRPGSALIDEDAFAAFLAPLNQSEWVVYGLPSCVRAERTARQTLALMTDANAATGLGERNLGRSLTGRPGNPMRTCLVRRLPTD